MPMAARHDSTARLGKTGYEMLWWHHWQSALASSPCLAHLRAGSYRHRRMENHPRGKKSLLCKFLEDFLRKFFLDCARGQYHHTRLLLPAKGHHGTVAARGAVMPIHRPLQSIHAR